MDNYLQHSTLNADDIGSNVSSMQIPSMLPESPMLLLFYHGNDISGSPIYTVDMRNAKLSNDTGQSNSSSSSRHFISKEYQNRTKVIFSNETPNQAQLILDNIQLNDTGLYWCRVDFRWMRTLISTIELKVHGRAFSI